MKTFNTALHKAIAIAFILFLGVFSLKVSTQAQSCTPSINTFTTNPASPVVAGTIINMSGSGNCGTSRFTHNGTPFQELGSPSLSDTRQLNEVGTHTLCYLLRGDGDWSTADSRCNTYEVTDGGSPQPSNCSITSFSISPTFGTVGTIFTVSGSGECDGASVTVRFSADGVVFAELGSPSYTATWNSSGYTASIHSIAFQVTAGDWSQAATQIIEVDLSGTPPPPAGNPTCHIEFFTISPPSPVRSGTTISLHGKGDCGTSRFTINGNPYLELGVPELRESLQLIGLGTYNICYQLRGDGGWANADSRCQTYVVTNQETQPTQVPAPAPISPLPPEGPSATCRVIRFDVSPRQAPVGTTFTLAGEGSCTDGAVTTRMLVNGVPVYEFGGAINNAQWNSSGYPEGTYTIGFQARSTDWSQAATAYITITLGNGSPSQPPNSSPSQPPLLGCNAPSSSWVDFVTVNAQVGVNIRQEPSISSAIIGRARYDCSFKQVGGNNNGWIPISFGSGETVDGWVSACCVIIGHNSVENPSNPNPSEEEITFAPSMTFVGNRTDIEWTILNGHREAHHYVDFDINGCLPDGYIWDIEGPSNPGFWTEYPRCVTTIRAYFSWPSDWKSPWPASSWIVRIVSLYPQPAPAPIPSNQ